MTLDESVNETDILDEGNGIKIVSENKLATYLEGAVIDYVESGDGGGFEVKTSKSGGSCGCG